MRIYPFVLSLLILTSFSQVSAQIIYVKAGATGDGSSWANATGDLQSSISSTLSGGGGFIWVAEGTYYGTFSISNSGNPSGPTPPTLTIIGGFPNTGNPDLSQRDPISNRTILSGDTDMNDTYNGGLVQTADDIAGANVIVMKIFRGGENLTIDGFIFNAGSASGADIFNHGGAISNYAAGTNNISNPHFINCQIIGNYSGGNGGGVSSIGTTQSALAWPRFTDCYFSGNKATNSGGAIDIYAGNSASSHATIVNSTIVNNTSAGSSNPDGGGGVRLYLSGSTAYGSLTITNSTVSGNTAVNRGGGILCSGFSYVEGSMDIINSLFTGNLATNGSGGGIYIGADTYANNAPFPISIISSTTSGNRAGGSGGGIYNGGTSLSGYQVVTLTNLISWNNQDVSGTGTSGSSFAAAPQTQNNITYSLLEGQNPPGTGNINGTLVANDPDFTNILSPASAPSATGDFHLQSSSPVLDAGNNAAIPQDTYDVDGDANTTETTPDLDLTNRIKNNTVDLGPYEYNAVTCTAPVVSAPTVTQPTCAVPTGTIIINSPTAGTLEYSVNNGSIWQASSTFSGLTAGSYYLKVRFQNDPSCMTSYASNPVTLFAATACCTPPVVNAPNVTQPTCAVPTGTIAINSPTAGTLEYSVNNGSTWQASSTFNGLTAGSYYLKVRFQNDPSCMTSYASNPVTLFAATGCCTPPVVNAPTVTQPTCAVPTGIIAINSPTAGTLEYSINNGSTWQASSTFSGLTAGSYHLKVRFQNDPSCMTSYASNPVTLFAAIGCCTPPVVSQVNLTQPTCQVQTGTIEIISPTAGSLEYSIDGGGTWQSSATFSGLTPNGYSAHVRFQNDPTCIGSDNIPYLIVAASGCCTPPVIKAYSYSGPTCQDPNELVTVYIVSPTAGSLEYSVDDGNTWQESPTFLDVSILILNLKVRFQNDPDCIGSWIDNPLVFNSLSPKYTNPCTSGDFIDDFKFDQFSNLNTGCGGPGLTNYSDFTAMGPTVIPGQSYPVTINVGPDYDQYIGIYIDFNDNKVFTDAGEFFDLGQTSNRTVSANIPIPGNFQLASTQMRVRSSFNGALTLADGCGTELDYGEIEDYTIYSTPSTGCVTTALLAVDNSVDPSTYHATQITSSGTVSNNQDPVYFRASQDVVLSNNFSVGYNTLFEIGIDPCVCVLSQWASSATASSFYNLDPAPDFYPEQATGEPDVLTCEDNPNAWAPATDQDIPEFLRLNYTIPVKAAGVRIYETANQFDPGFVYKIEYVDINDNVHIVWEGDDTTPCGSIFEPSIAPTTYLVKSVIVHTQLLGWEEIDAVQLIGAVCTEN